jgi:hypothetical protein
MTEAGWKTCINPQPLLDHLGAKASGRKSRLYAVACCRRLWDLLLDAAGRKAVEAAEQFADGLIGSRQLSRLGKAARGLTQEERPPGWTAYVGEAVCGREEHLVARQTADRAAGAVYLSKVNNLILERKAQTDLLRCIFGNPFSPVTINPAWRSWNGGTVVRLAQAAYDERHLPAGTLDPARLAVLADALEEAGATDAVLLGHLRGPGPHVRGCAAVDALLGKV